MTPREELETLAAKVEAAEGADRWIDFAIYGMLEPYMVEGWDEAWFVRNGVFPTYTGSLDAAMTLVPEGWYWCLRRYPKVAAAAEVGGIHEARAATPALALCAAALRARASALTGYGEKGE